MRGVLMVRVTNLDCGRGSYDLASFSCTSLCMSSCTTQTDVMCCHLVGRGCGITRVESNAQCARAASSGRLLVNKLHDRFHFVHVGFETWSLGHTHNLVTHNLSHTNNFVTQLYHTQLFTYNLFNLSILHHLLCLSFLPRSASTFVSAYWKKLTCGPVL
jgi:hypothetical protein